MAEEYQIKKQETLKNIKIADHILNVSYPIVKDAKLLKIVLNKIYNALYNAIAMLLYYERYHKRISVFIENYNSMIESCKEIFLKYKISKGYIGFLHEIKELIDIQKKSEIEFVRKENYVFASKNYELNSLSINQIKDYMQKAKLFINELIKIVN
ncbi:MAG: hypothetical protein QXR96_03275 [Candidatus Woesearchaeota archaeon]